MAFMVGLSEASMGSLLQKMGVLLAREYSLIRGINGDIQEISDELSSMQAFLVVLDKHKELAEGSTSNSASNNHPPAAIDVKNWVRQVRDATYDIEDTVDEFTHRIGRRRHRDGFIFSVVVARLRELATWYPRRSIVLDIKELNGRAQRISERRIRYGVDNPTKRPAAVDKDNPSNNNWGRGDPWYWFEEEGLQKPPPPRQERRVDEIQDDRVLLARRRQLVGVKDPVGMAAGTMEELGGWLSDADKNQGVLALVGTSGVGKTTLAMALFRQFQDQFERRAIVTVSQKFNLQGVLRSISRQIMLRTTSQLDNDEMNENQLSQLLRQQLTGKRFFLLIDDVWSPTAWLTIRKFLPSNEKGSKILVTTRFEAVARACFRVKETDLLHRVDRLSDRDSRELFMENLDPPELYKWICEPRSRPRSRPILDVILDGCAGLPLAIVLVSGAVATTDWWAPSIHAKTPVEIIIGMSYERLSTNLQSCMLYLGTFPKSYKISRKRLTRRWLAEGLLGAKPGRTAEEVADRCFSYLLKTNIIRPTDHCTDGTVKTCQVHDMIHEFIVRKSSEESFVNVVGGHWLMPKVISKVRRLSVHTTDQVQEEIEDMNLSRVRSLAVFGTSHKFPFRFFKFRIVQVLDLEGCRGLKKHHMKRVSEMILLRYLSLRKTDIDRLPSKIGRLTYLETLDIRDTNVSVLPKSIASLQRLRNLLGGNKKTRKSVKLPKEMASKPMVTLRILSGIQIVEGPYALTDLHYYTTLRKLLIYKLNLQKDSLGFQDLMSSIEYLGSGHLQSLEIDDESSEFINSMDSMAIPPKHLTALHLHGKLIEVPKWITYLEDLVKLTLPVTVLNTDTFQLLASMPALFCLTFSFTAEKQDSETVAIIEENKLNSGGSISVPGGGHKSLKLLRFTSPLLPSLTFSEEAMPELQRIDLQFTRLEGLSNMDNLASLLEVHLTMDKQADEATREIVTGLATAARGSSAKKVNVIVDAR